MSEAKKQDSEEQVNNRADQKILLRNQVLTDVTSLNAYGVVTLSNGQRVNVQMTNRHGFTAETAYKDFKEFVAFLDMCASDHAVEFWDGSRADNGKTSAAVKQEHETGGGEKSESNGHKNEFACGLLEVEYKNKKAYFTVSGVEGAKFPKFPVRVWYEVLEEAGISEKDVDPRKGKSLLGWTAVYEKDENGKVKKVVELRKSEFAEDDMPF